MKLRMGTWLMSGGLASVLGFSIVWAQPAEPPPLAPPPAKKGPAPATIKLRVPPNAVIWFGDQRMSQTGMDRAFVSPPLELKKVYEYTIKVTWPVPGQQDSETTHKIEVRAGDTVSHDLTSLAPPGSFQPAPVFQPAPPRFRQPQGSGYR